MPTRAQLAQRRALVTAAKRRRPARPMPTAQPPRPTAYVGALRDVAEELNDALGAELSDALGVRVDAADDGMPAFNRRDLLTRLTRLAGSIVKRRGSFLDRAIDACAETVATKSNAEWAKQGQAVVGIDLSKVEPTLTPTINRFRRANLDLITSVARDKVERVKRILDDNAGARVETIRDRIMEEQGVTKRQAALIARDQVLSLNAQVTEKRHAAAGVTEYIWRTSDYQCRCTAEPVIEGFEEEAVRADAGDKDGEGPKNPEFEKTVNRAPDGEFSPKTGGSFGGASFHRPPKGGGPKRSLGGGGPTTTQPVHMAQPAPAAVPPSPQAAIDPRVHQVEAAAVAAGWRVGRQVTWLSAAWRTLLERSPSDIVTRRTQRALTTSQLILLTVQSRSCLLQPTRDGRRWPVSRPSIVGSCRDRSLGGRQAE